MKIRKAKDRLKKIKAKYGITPTDLKEAERDLSPRRSRPAKGK